MAKACFTVVEANGMLPRVEEAFGRLFQIRSQLSNIRRQLEIANAMPESGDFEVLVEDASLGIVNRRGAVKALRAAMEEQLEELRDSGVILQNVEEGRVDWEACDGDRKIHLCWQLGESEVGHWHDAQEPCDARASLGRLASTDDDS